MEKQIENINESIAFFEDLSDSIFDNGMIDTRFFPGNVGSIIFSAIANRLKTVGFAVSNGFFSDVYVLMRMIMKTSSPLFISK